MSQPPNHVAVVMDGNGRWATQRGLKRTDGHRAGQDAVDRIVDAAIDERIAHLTLYAFSTENWKRPPSEVRFLLDDTEDFILSRRERYGARGVRMRWIGRRERKVPRRILDIIDETTTMTSENRGMILNIAFNYGSRAEILDAVRAVASRHHEDGKRITEASFRRELADVPDVDLFIRTGGEQRLSNYLLWQSAYAELYFTDTLWPDADAATLRAALDHYASRQRRFGKV
ncbi:MAG: polyprenyl diphosphate synthase [Actinomycetota bacterium]